MTDCGSFKQGITGMMDVIEKAKAAIFSQDSKVESVSFSCVPDAVSDPRGDLATITFHVLSRSGEDRVLIVEHWMDSKKNEDGVIINTVYPRVSYVPRRVISK